jgi:transposase
VSPEFQGKRRAESDYLAYDSTSISSYSKGLRQVRYGKNKDHEHLYYSPERALEDEKTFNSSMAILQEELESGQRHPDHEKQYAKYFEVRSTPVRGVKVIAKEEAIKEAKRDYGYFTLLSNEIKDAVAALEIFRNKDLVEKAFDNLKERLNLRRVAVSSELSLDGKLFVEFIALIFLSYITKKMQENNLFKGHTLHEVLDQFDIIECFEVPGQQVQVGETTKRQIASIQNRASCRLPRTLISQFL